MFAALVAGEGGGDPAAIVQARGLGQIADAGALAAVVAEVVAAHPQQAEQFRAGKENLMGFFVGQVMRATGGRAEPQLAQQLLREELGACADSPFLLTPGPVPVPPEVLAVMAMPQQHHRSARVRRDLRRGAAQAQARVPHRARRAAVHGLGHRARSSRSTPTCSSPAIACCA